MDARYVFAVRFRLEPAADVTVDPREFETRLYRAADDPGERGWMFFRDTLWRGRVNDEAHVRELASNALGVSVVDVEYRAFETDREYRDALEAAVAANLEEFRADDVTEVVSKYFGSSVEVTD